MAAQTITESTANRLVDAVHQLTTSIAVFENKLSEFARDLDRQTVINNDIEARMKQREIDAAQQLKDIAMQGKWQERATGALITIAISLIVEIGVGLVIMFGKGHP